MDVKIGLIALWLVIQIVIGLPKRERRVVNGNTIIRGTWPFLVSLHYKPDDPYTRKSKMKHMCGGTLIHPRWVLTAAHCIGFSDDYSNPNNWDIVVGEYNQFVDDIGEQVIEPEEFFIHPNFTYRLNYNIDNDISLIKLKEEVDFGPYAMPISIDRRNDIELNSECQLGGWGQVSSVPYGWGMYIPLETTLFIFDTDKCKEMYDPLNDIYETQAHIDESWICAGVPLQNQSTIERIHGGASGMCNGDSGGPLICYNHIDGGDVVSGIASISPDCGSSEYPDGFTRVSYFQNWIEDVIRFNTPVADSSFAEILAKFLGFS